VRLSRTPRRQVLLQGYLIYPLPRREKVSLPAIASLLVQARPTSRGFNRGGRARRAGASATIQYSVLPEDDLEHGWHKLSIRPTRNLLYC